MQEALAHLYLRLNGYFTSGFIAHSATWGEDRAEFDALAVRLPFNREPDRLIEPSRFLVPEGGLTDLLLCEVKSRGQALHFNPGVRRNPDILATAIRWAGVVDEAGIPEAVRGLERLVQTGTKCEDARTGVRVGPVRIRPLLISPERAAQPRANQTWFAGEVEVLGFVNRCLNPQVPRASCSTQYGFSAWGRWLAPVAIYFKGLRDSPPKMEDLYLAVSKSRPRA